MHTREARVRLAAALGFPALGLAWWDLKACRLLSPSQCESTKQSAGEGSPPRVFLLRTLELTVDGTLPGHLAASLVRLALGASVGLVIGVTLAVLMLRWRRLDLVLGTPLQLLAPVPMIVWVPFMIVFFGLGETWKVALVGLAVTLIVLVQSVEGFRSIEERIAELAYTYEKTWLETVRHLLLPGAAPYILTGLRVAVAISWVGLFIAESWEAKQHTRGLGWFISHNQKFGRYSEEFAGILYLGVAGLVLDVALTRAQTRMLKWRDSHSAHQRT